MVKRPTVDCFAFLSHAVFGGDSLPFLTSGQASLRALQVAFEGPVVSAEAQNCSVPYICMYKKRDVEGQTISLHTQPLLSPVARHLIISE